LKILLLTFGEGTIGFTRAAKRLQREFSDFFPEQNALIVNAKILKKISPEFWSSKQKFVKMNPRGYGNWVWKPTLVNLAFLGEFGEFDLLIYLDAGCELNFSTKTATRRFENYVQMAMESGGLAFAHKAGQFGIQDFSEVKWTKPAVLNYLNPDSETLLSPQLQAGCFFLARQSSQFAFDWFKISNVNDSAFLQDEAVIGQYTHRNDQSIFSILWKQAEYRIIDDETFFDFKKDSFASSFPIWTSRNASSRKTLDYSVFGKTIRRIEALVSQVQFHFSNHWIR